MVLAVQLAIVQYSSHGSNTGISLARVLDNYGPDFRQSEFKVVTIQMLPLGVRFTHDKNLKSLIVIVWQLFQ